MHQTPVLEASDLIIYISLCLYVKSTLLLPSLSRSLALYLSAVPSALFINPRSSLSPAGEANDKDVQVVELPIVDSLHPRPPYLPLAIPEDLAQRLHRLHGDPSVWWVSQFVKYLIRPQAWLEKEIQDTTAKLGFRHPIIG